MFSLAAVSIYGGIIPRVKFRYLVPGIYTTVLGFGMAGVAWVGAGIALAWAVVGAQLGRTYDRADSVESAQRAPE